MIDIKEINKNKEIKYGSYPVDFKRIGEDDEDFKIFISEETINDIKGYLSSDKTKELGGVLIGDIYLDEAKNNFIVINSFIIARYTEANVTRLTFSHKTWEDINCKIESDYPNKIVLGWFHSHPGHTVFLSTYDKFIHENFFSGESFVAYVFDPINNDEGFFFWKDSILIRAKCFYLYTDLQIKGENKNIFKDDSSMEKKTKKNNPLIYTSLIISLLCLLFSVILFLKYYELKDTFNDVNVINSKIKELKEEDIKTNNRIDEIITNLESDNDSIKSINNIIKYQIKPGETLRKLALQFYYDEGKYNLLVRHNNLKDENDISVGQIIEIPMEK